MELTDSEMMEVHFEVYCKLCEFEKCMDYEDPCNECLETPCREGTIKPIKYQKKEK